MALRHTGTALELGDEQGNPRGEADFVVVSAPAPQAADVLDHSPESRTRVALLRGVTYDPAVVIMAGLRVAEPEWWFVEFDTGPIASITIETAKGRACVDGLVPVVARLTTRAGAALTDDSDAAALAVSLPPLREALAADSDAVGWAQVKRWRFSRPTVGLTFADANPLGARVLVCGDTVASGGLADVYMSGLAAASRILSEVTS